MESSTRAVDRPKTVKKKRKWYIAPPTWLLMIWVFLFVFLPLLYVVAISFMERGESWGVQAVFTLENYKMLFDPLYRSIYLSSLNIGLLTTVIALLLGYPFAYGMAKMNSRWKRIGMFLLVAPFWISSLLRLYGWTNLLNAKGWINRLLTLIVGAEKPLRLLGTKGSVMLGMVYALLPIMILTIYSSTEKLDWAQVEAARDLGAGRFTAFRTVTVPQTVPGILAGCVLVFIPSMGLFFLTDLMGNGKQILIIGKLIQQQVQTAHNWPFAAALSVLMLALAALVIYLYSKGSGQKDLSGLV